MIKKSFQLRYACGCYWIVKISAESAEYRAPIITNETGCAVWNCLQQDRTIVETAQTLTALYKIPYEEALEDTNAFIQLLKQNGCIETDDNKMI